MSRAKQLRFAVAFASIAGILFVIYTFPYAENGAIDRCFSAYLRGYASFAGAALSVLDSRVSVQGQTILGRFDLEIVKNCDAMEACILFIAAVLAFPTSLLKRVTGVGLGVSALVLLNVARICSLYFVGVYAPSAFEVFHLELWPLLLVAAACVAFLKWASWASSMDAAGITGAPP